MQQPRAKKWACKLPPGGGAPNGGRFCRAAPACLMPAPSAAANRAALRKRRMIASECMMPGRRRGNSASDITRPRQPSAATISAAHQSANRQGFEYISNLGVNAPPARPRTLGRAARPDPSQTGRPAGAHATLLLLFPSPPSSPGRAPRAQSANRHGILMCTHAATIAKYLYHDHH